MQQLSAAGGGWEDLHLCGAGRTRVLTHLAPFQNAIRYLFAEYRELYTDPTLSLEDIARNSLFALEPEGRLAPPQRVTEGWINLTSCCGNTS